MHAPLLTLVEYGRTRFAYDHCFRKLSHTPAIGAVDHRAYDITEFANHSPVFHPLERSKTRLAFVAVFVSRSRTAHPCEERKKKRKKEKLGARVLWMLLASDRGNEFPATKLSASIERWPQLAIISSLIPSNILLPSFRSFLSRTRGCVLKVSRRTRRGRILFFSIWIFLNHWLKLANVLCCSFVIYFNMDIFERWLKFYQEFRLNNVPIFWNTMHAIVIQLHYPNILLSELYSRNKRLFLSDQCRNRVNSTQ